MAWFHFSHLIQYWIVWYSTSINHRWLLIWQVCLQRPQESLFLIICTCSGLILTVCKCYHFSSWMVFTLSWELFMIILNFKLTLKNCDSSKTQEDCFNCNGLRVEYYTLYLLNCTHNSIRFALVLFSWNL